MPQSNVIALPPGARERIEAAVEAAFERQIATTIAFSAIPSTRSQEGPCQDMFAGLLRERGYEVDDWIINQDELKSLPGYGPAETDFSRARTVVGTARGTGRFDNGVIDYLVNVLGNATYGLGSSLRRLQTGSLRNYVLFLAIAAAGLFAVLAYFVSFAVAR